ncbi:hypothetical protein ACF0H5_010975 [Mactra antiquata]
MTLARQMYPGQSDIHLKQFAKATKYPYGYLFIDLKPFTQNDQRLECIRRSNQTLDYSGHMTPQETTKEGVLPEVNHSAVGVQTGHIEERENSQDYLGNNSEEIMDKGQACDDCGQLFDTVHDVQRHVKNGWCPELMGQKKRNYEELSDSEQEEDTVEDNEGFVQLWKRARESNDQNFENIYNTFIDNGEESDTAQEMAEERIQTCNEKDFFGKYETLIDKYILPLRNNRLHTKIMAQIDKLISKGYSTTSAVTKVLRKHKNSFQDLFDVEFTDDEEEEEEK